MTIQRRMWVLAGIMALVAVGVSATALVATYRTGLHVQEDRLENIVQSQARMLEAVALFDIQNNRDYPGGAAAATLAQYHQANLEFSGMGRTGEFTLAERDGDWIRFLIRQRDSALAEPDSVPWDGGMAEPQRRALSGESGVLVGVDYRGETVLAAYEPVGVHGWGMVAKMDLAEVRAPFLRVSGELLLVAVGLIALGLVLFRRLGEPFIRQLSLSEERYRLIADNTLDGIWILDSDFRFTYVNPAVEPLLGYLPEEWVGSNLQDHCSREDFIRARNAAVAMAGDPAGAGGLRLDMHLFKKDGTPLPVEVTARPLMMPDGELHFQGVTRSVKDRVEKEHALQEKAEEFEALFRASPAGILQLDAEGLIRRWNPAASRILGWGEEKALGKPVLSLYSGDEAQARGLLARVLGGETIRGMELSLERTDGSSVEINLSTAPIRGPDGSLVGAMASFEDITERRRAERESQELQQRLEGFFYFSPAIQYLKDLQGRHLEVNPRFEDITGVPRDKALGKTNEDLFPPEVAGRLSAADAAVMETGDPLSDEESLHWRGKLWTFLTTKFPMFDAQMKVSGLGAISLDITERREVQEALKRSEAESRSLVENAPYGIFRIATTGAFLSANPALVNMLGYESEEELLSEAEPDAVYRDHDQPGRLIGEILESDQVEGADLRWRRKDGKGITVRVRGRWMEPKVGGMEAEAGTEKVLEMMAEDVSERRLLEEQLRQSQKMEAVGQLTGGIAHDFNNELSVILLNAQLAKQELEAGGDVSTDDLTQIQEAAQRASHITRQLLGFSRRAELRVERTDLSSVIRGLEKLLGRVIRENIQLQVQVEEAVPVVLVDPRSVEQIILNLTSNAQDAMPDGGNLTIRVNLTELDAEYCHQHPQVRPGSYVRILLGDTGVGMDETTRDRVFEPFFTTKGLGSGTGLGMAMVYGITKQQGGHVHLYSEPGEGTEVHLYFPVVEGTAAAAPAQNGQTESVGGGETILVVEDEHAVRSAAKRALERVGYTVLTAEDGRMAMDIMQERGTEVDLVVSDLVMPEIGGLALYEWLKEGYPETRFLLVSGYTGERRNKGKRIDPEIPFVGKPWTLKELYEQVRRALDGAP